MLFSDRASPVGAPDTAVVAELFIDDLLLNGQKKTEKATLMVALVLSSLLFVFAVPLGLADVHHCPITTPSGSSGVLVTGEERTKVAQKAKSIVVSYLQNDKSITTRCSIVKPELPLYLVDITLN